jgi:hypothetical protein
LDGFYSPNPSVPQSLENSPTAQMQAAQAARDISWNAKNPTGTASLLNRRKGIQGLEVLGSLLHPHAIPLAAAVETARSPWLATRASIPAANGVAQTTKWLGDLPSTPVGQNILQNGWKYAPSLNLTNTFSDLDFSQKPDYQTTLGDLQ